VLRVFALRPASMAMLAKGVAALVEAERTEAGVLPALMHSAA
jgi:hypothetical protein